MPKRLRNRRRCPSPSPASGRSRGDKNASILERLERRLDILERKGTGRKRPHPLTESSTSEFSDCSTDSHDESHLSDNFPEDQCVNDSLGCDNPKSEVSGSLHPDILSLIGDEGGSIKEFGPPIQQDVANVWISVAKNGLDTEKRKRLLDKYPYPENGLVLRGLKLNSVVKDAITEPVQTRDNRLSNLQAQISSCLSAIGLVITDLLKEEKGGNKQHIEQLSDAGHLLSDIHNMETTSRRNLVSMNLNKGLRETLLDSPVIDEWLFGQNLDERLRTAKALQASSQQLKRPEPFINKAKTTKALNFKSSSYNKQ